jgi:hypothetical protein
MKLWIKILIVFLLFLLLIIILTVNYIDGYRYITISSKDIFELDREYRYKPTIKNCIISLTTTPPRLKHLKPILMSLLDSSVAVTEIRLNVPYTSCKGIPYVIPKWLTKLKNVKIHRTEKDWGPATKLLPTLIDCYSNLNMNTKIIVVDDDVIYGYYMVETINEYFEKYNRNKKVAITMYGDKVAKDNTMKYDMSTRAGNYMAGDRYTDILRGHSAYMVTPNMFTTEIFDYTKHPKECFFVDDNYFSFHLKRNNVRILMAGLSYKAIPFSDTVNGAIGGLHATLNKNGKNEVIVNTHFNKKLEKHSF